VILRRHLSAEMRTSLAPTDKIRKRHSIATASDVSVARTESSGRSTSSADDEVSSSSCPDEEDEMTSMQSSTTVVKSSSCATTLTDDVFDSVEQPDALSPRSDAPSLQWDNTGMEMTISAAPSGDGGSPLTLRDHGHRNAFLDDNYFTEPNCSSIVCNGRRAR
jgi:hypothetical protein